MLNMNAYPIPDASEEDRGAVSTDRQTLKGKKAFVNDVSVYDTLVTGESTPIHVVEVEGDVFNVSVHPMQLGGFGEEGDVENIFSTPGLRLFEVFRRTLSLSMHEQLNIELEQVDEDSTRITLRADQVNVPGRLDVGSVVAGSVEAYDLDVIGNVDVAGVVDASGFTVNGVPLEGGGVDSVGTFGNTPNGSGASISGSTLTLQPATDTFPGGVSTNAQTIAGEKTFTSFLTAALGIFTNLIRAVGVALVLRSDVGAASGDTAVNLGTSVPESSLHAAARIATIASGIGGVQTEKVIISKGGAFTAPVTIVAPTVANAYTLNLFGGATAGVGGINYSPGGLGNIIFGMSSNFPGVSATNWPLVFSQNANAYNQSHLMLFSVGNASGVLPSVPIFDYEAPANTAASQRVARWRVGGAERAHLTHRGTFGCAGDMNDSISFGDQTINAAKGSFIHNGAGSGPSITITNDQVDTHSFVAVALENNPLVSTADEVLGYRVEVSTGQFVLRFFDGSGADATPRFETKWRFYVVQ